MATRKAKAILKEVGEIILQKSIDSKLGAQAQFCLKSRSPLFSVLFFFK